MLQLQRQYDQDPSGMTIKTIDVLCSWLLSHVLGTDRKHLQQLHARGGR